MKLLKESKILLILLIVSIGIIPVVNISSERIFEPIILNPETKSWTFMMYFCGDTRDHYVTQDLDNSENVLNAAMQWTFNGIRFNDLLAGSENDLNIIVLFDHPYSQDYPLGQKGNEERTP